MAGTYAINYSTSYYLPNSSQIIDIYDVNMTILLNGILISSGDASGMITDASINKLVAGSASHIHNFVVGDKITMNTSMNIANGNYPQQRTTQLQIYRIR